jgi:hypothetical protein
MHNGFEGGKLVLMHREVLWTWVEGKGSVNNRHANALAELKLPGSTPMKNAIIETDEVFGYQAGRTMRVSLLDVTVRARNVYEPR